MSNNELYFIVVHLMKNTIRFPKPKSFLLLDDLKIVAGHVQYVTNTHKTNTHFDLVLSVLLYPYCLRLTPIKQLLIQHGY